MKHLHLKSKRLLSLVIVLITTQSVFSQPAINTTTNEPDPQVVSSYSQPITSTSSIRDEKTGISIYPNPASDELTIQSSQTIHTIRIFDMLGRMIKQSEPDQLQTKIKVTDLIAGKYFISIQLTDAKSPVIQSFVKV